MMSFGEHSRFELCVAVKELYQSFAWTSRPIAFSAVVVKEICTSEKHGYPNSTREWPEAERNHNR